MRSTHKNQMCLYTSAINNVKKDTKNTIQLIIEPKTIIYIGSNYSGSDSDAKNYKILLKK